jgi:D-alanyl-lipoteichoic acid acyltransferase DltB (MBOAT superfamily)
MGFNSLDYVVFLTLALCGYWLLLRHHALRLTFMVLASCVFYMAWDAHYIVLLLLATVLDYAVGIGLAKSVSPRTRKLLLFASVAANLGLLGAFKYYNFFSTATADVLALIGIHISPARLDVLLPVGISFYTFETLSYTIDVYRGHAQPTRSFLKFAFFVTFFPHLVAGPIVRPSKLMPQLDVPPRLAQGAVANGLFLIALGMIKKVVFADYLAINLIDRVFDTPGVYSSLEVLLALYAYTLQIYCDFSGYTDVARGSAKLFAIELPENFDRPYQATSPAEFWRRWHMTLSTWLRDYLYFPLGGSRVAPARAYFNLFLTIFLIGLWHGAAWTFVIYGTLQGMAMVIHRFFHRRSGRSDDTVDPFWLTALKIVGTLHFVVLSRVFFRASDVDNAGEMIAGLFAGSLSTAQVPAAVLVVMALGFAAHYTPKAVIEALRARFVALSVPAQGTVLAAVGGCLMLVASGEVVPYIYFQF